MGQHAGVRPYIAEREDIGVLRAEYALDAKSKDEVTGTELEMVTEEWTSKGGNDGNRLRVRAKYAD